MKALILQGLPGLPFLCLLRLRTGCGTMGMVPAGRSGGRLAEYAPGREREGDEAVKSEKEITEKVLEAANGDEAVRAVFRTDLLPIREYAYYNFCFVARGTEKYDGDAFRTLFGDRILLYRGDKNYPELFPNGAKAHLMVFRDGTTIAITVMDRAAFLARYRGEQNRGDVWIGGTYLKIMDKDGAFPGTDRLEEKQTLFAEKPSEEEFDGINREFWWVLKTFAEYTLRKELPSAMFYLNTAVRELLNRMIRWRLFLCAGAPVDMGILDGNMEKLLDAELFSLYKDTYPAAEYGQIWKALDAAAELWTALGHDVAGRCGYAYPAETEKDMLTLIRSMKEQAR